MLSCEARSDSAGMRERRQQGRLSNIKTHKGGTSWVMKVRRADKIHGPRCERKKAKGGEKDGRTGPERGGGDAKGGWEGSDASYEGGGPSGKGTLDEIGVCWYGGRVGVVR